MEIRYLELSSGEMPVDDYVVKVGAERGQLIMRRLNVLSPLTLDSALPSPPVSEVFGVEGLFQFLIDYEDEVHRVIFCEHKGTWLLVDAFRCDDDPIPDSDRDRALDRWALLDRG